MVAAKEGYEAIVSSLLAAGSDKEAKTKYGFTPLIGRYNFPADDGCTARSRGGGSFSTGCGSGQGGED